MQMRRFDEEKLVQNNNIIERIAESQVNLNFYINAIDQCKSGVLKYRKSFMDAFRRESRLRNCQSFITSLFRGD